MVDERQSPVEIVLGQDAQARLEEVEAAYGVDLLLTDLESGDSDNNRTASGEAGLGDDGTPTIWLNRRLADPAATFVHELSHLGLRAGGVPTRYVLDEGTFNDDFTRAHVWRYLRPCRNVVVHTLFFGRMRAWGYDPSVNLVGRIRAAVDALDCEDRTADVLMIALQVLLESGDDALVERFEQLCTECGWGGAYEKAHEIVGALETAELDTPEQIVDQVLHATSEVCGVSLASLTLDGPPHDRVARVAFTGRQWEPDWA